MASNGNINVVLKSTNKKQQATIKVKQSQDFMNVMEKLTDLCFNRTNEMSEGLYLELQNGFLELYNLELMSDILIQSKKKHREQGRLSYTMEEKREALKNGAKHIIMCNNCSRIINKSFLKEHLASNVCKDNKKIIEAAGKDGINENFNEEILCKYITHQYS